MTQQTPAGWHPDPHNSQQQRYWNGTAWTEHVAPASASAAAASPSQAEWAPQASGNILPGGSLKTYSPISSPSPQTSWWRKPWVLIVAGVVTLLLVVAAVGDDGSDGTSNTQKPDALVTSPSQPVVPTTVLSLTGNGDSQTQEFTVADEWAISYSFDCSNFINGSAGNFAITVNGTDGVPSLTNNGPNALAPSGASTVYNHHGGTYYLSILSECDWKLSVISG